MTTSTIILSVLCIVGALTCSVLAGLFGSMASGEITDDTVGVGVESMWDADAFNM